MSIKVGDWVALRDGTVAVVRSVADDPSGIALAETVSGLQVDRPMAYAAVQWTPLSEEGLKVRRALAPEEIRQLAVADPAALVVSALVDASGEASVEELKAALSPDPIPPEDLDRWWRRAQGKFDRHPRIDAALARQRRYRLLLKSVERRK